MAEPTNVAWDDNPLEYLCEKAALLPSGPEKKNILLKIFDMDKERFHYELAKWYIDDDAVFAELKITPIPNPPEEMVEYYHLSKREKRKMTDAFWAQPIVSEFLDRKLFIKSDNKNKYQCAKDILSYLPENDSHRRNLLTDRIKEMTLDLPKGGVDVLPEENNSNLGSTPLDWV